VPTYEYRCTACDNEWEELQKISEPPVEICPKCSQKTAKRQISGGNFILKGGGWYADLYSSSPKKAPANGESKGGEAAGKSEKSGGEGTSPKADAPAKAEPAKPTGPPPPKADKS
jgi:putative FmdB family regulatory protein